MCCFHRSSPSFCTLPRLPLRVAHSRVSLLRRCLSGPPVHLVVLVAPGGASMILGAVDRPGRLGDHLKQTFVIDNRPGAGTNIGVGVVAHGTPDGYTLLLVPQSVTTNATLYPNLDFNFIRDIVPIAMISRLPLGVEIKPVYSRRRPSPGVHRPTATGSIPARSAPASGRQRQRASHIGGEFFKDRKTGIDMVHVPYRSGAPALTDLIGGQVQVMFSPLPESLYGAIKAEQGARAWRRGHHRAVAGAARSAATVPLRRSRVSEASTWQGSKRAERHAGRDRRAAQPGDKRGAGRSHDHGAACGARQHPDADVAGRL